jgi:hypothetical protein
MGRRLALVLLMALPAIADDRAPTQNQPPPETPARKFELTVAPVGVPIVINQIGDFGSLARFGMQFNPLIGGYASAFVRWFRTETLLGGIRPAGPDGDLSIDGQLGVGVTFTPVRLTSWVVSLRAGLGLAHVSVGFPARSTAFSFRFGSTGIRPVGNLGLEVAYVVSSRLRVGLEVRNTLTSSGVSAVNGCSAGDLTNIVGSRRPPSQVEELGPGCDVFWQGGFTPAQALQRTTEGGSFVNRLSLDLGVTFSF